MRLRAEGLGADGGGAGGGGGGELLEGSVAGGAPQGPPHPRGGEEV